MCGDDVDQATTDQSSASLFAPNAFNSAAWARAYDANSPGGTTTDVPIFIYHGEADELVPVALSATAAEKYCKLGATVSRKTYPGADHTSVVPQALLEVNSYLQARLSGQAAPSTC